MKYFPAFLRPGSKQDISGARPRRCYQNLISILLFIFLCGVTSTRSIFAQWSSDPTINTAVCTAAGEQSVPIVASDGVGGIIITWYDHRNGIDDNIYAQRFNAAGVRQWTTNGLPICTAAQNQTPVGIVPDGAGGAMIVWSDVRNGSPEIYAQRINGAGVVQWATNGVSACNTEGNPHLNTNVIPDGTGGVIITWSDGRKGVVNPDIYAQRISSNGIRQWAASGVEICMASREQVSPYIASDGAGGAIITWYDFRNGANYDIYAQRINASGVVQWATNGIVVCNAANSQYLPLIVSDGAGGGIIVWADKRNSDDFDIYAQRINSAGTSQWTTNGIAVTTKTGIQVVRDVIPDGSGGIILAWDDRLTVSDVGDIYAQRINAAGVVQWATNGTVICADPDNQTIPALVSDQAGGAIIAWNDERNYNGGANIYAQRVLGSGLTQWTPNGVAISTAVGEQYNPDIASDGAGGAIISWADTRNGSTSGTDTYVQNVRADGAIGPTVMPIPISVTYCPNSNSPISMTSDITGTTYQWQVNTGSGFVNISNNSNYSGTNSNTILLINVPSNWYGYLYRCVVNGVLNSSIFKIRAFGTWTGSADSNWNNAANWNCNAVPDEHCDVIINSGTVVVPTNRKVRSLTVSPPANFKVMPGATFTITH